MEWLNANEGNGEELEIPYFSFTEENRKMTKKQKVVFAVVAAVLVLGMIMSYIFLMKNQHIDSTPEEKKMPAMSDTEDYEVRESDESIQSSETEEDYYMTSTGVTAEEVEQFAEEIKNDILKHDWDALSEKLSYPIPINGTTVNNREDFLKLDIDGKLNQEFVEAVRAETCRKMFCNWQGVMMGMPDKSGLEMLIMEQELGNYQLSELIICSRQNRKI
jgi:hypothetical protein